MKHTIDLAFNSTKIEVEGFSGWDKENPHRVAININLGDIEIINMIEEDAEYLNHGTDRELHEETFEKVEIEKDKLALENDELSEENQYLKWENAKLRRRVGIV